MATFSIREEFRGAKVFLTGASGYVGSVVLEQLLRCTAVDTVYCLLRPKREQDPQQRLDKVLHSTLFHKVRDTPVIKRARAVAGDILMADLGMGQDDRAMVESQVDIVLHCAADITLEADIQTTLRANVEGTRSVLALARRCPRLRAMVHTSSAYVNINMPSDVVVQERIYPLLHGGLEVDAEELVQELLGMDNAAANRRVKAYLGRWNFPNTYTFGKNLGEKVLAADHARAPLPLAIVRPSLICCVALEPVPGYCGNLAGPNGICAALSLGLYDSLDAVPFQPHRTWDIMAADFVGHTILAAAASESAATVSTAAAAALSQAGGTGDLVLSSGRSQRGLPSVHMSVSSLASLSQAALAAGKGSWGPHHHRRGSDLHTDQSSRSSGSDSSENSSRRCSVPGSEEGLSDDSSGLVGSHSNSSGSGEVPGRRPLAIYHAALGSNTFVTFQEGWSYWRAFVEQHPPPYRLAWGLPGNLPDDFTPSPAAVEARLRWTSIKVAAAAALLDLMGMGPAARALRNGLASFAVLNNSKLDRDHTFATYNTVALAERLCYEDAVTFPVVWKAIGTSRSPGGRLVPNRDPRRGPELAMTSDDYSKLMMVGVYQRLFKIKVEV